MYSTDPLTDPDCSVLLLPFAVVSAVLDDGGSEFFITEASFSIINSSKVKYESTKEVPKKEARGGYGRQRRTPQEEVSSQEGLLWLPSEFEVSFDGTTCSINSYINSLHPKQHASLYKNISRCFTAVLPLFEAVLSDLGMGKHVNQAPLRVAIPTDGDNGTWYSGGGWIDAPTEHDAEFQYEPADGEEWDEDACEATQERLHEAQQDAIASFNAGRTLHQPRLPSTFKPPPMPERKFSLCGRHLQVITKIASIELTPNKPRYEGGEWHVEGMRDERIVATACIYLESENVGETSLAFRTQIKEPKSSEWGRPKLLEGEWGVETGDEAGNELIYGLSKSLVQPRGVIRTLSGRALAWPNTLQHRVHPFELENKSKPGRRTILCFFLVDPTLRIRSTATVLPQAREWIQMEARAILIQVQPYLPFVIRSYIATFLGGGGLTYEEAADRRLRLMAERKSFGTGCRKCSGSFQCPSNIVL